MRQTLHGTNEFAAILEKCAKNKTNENSGSEIKLHVCV